jgi:large subunit ribosomal protein L16
MMQPKRTKYRKQMKGTNTGLAFNGNKVSFGEFGLKSTEHGRLTARQIEAARRVITRYVKRGGKLWIRIFPDVPVTKKPLEVRMGSGKGNVEYWVARLSVWQRPSFRSRPPSLTGRFSNEIRRICEVVAQQECARAE